VRENARLTAIEKEEILPRKRGTHWVRHRSFGIGRETFDHFQELRHAIGDDGGLLVNDYLQSVKYPEIFGGGDCISFQSVRLDKVGVYAVRQNPVLYGNLMAALNNSPMERFIPQKIYLLIFNLGDGHRNIREALLVWNGRLALRLRTISIAAS